MTDLDKLIEAVEENQWLEVQIINKRIASSARDTGAYWQSLDIESAYNGSLDAAKSLHEALLPGWGYCAKHFTSGKPRASVAKYPYSSEYFESDNPARAWLLAILKAYRAQVQG